MYVCVVCGGGGGAGFTFGVRAFCLFCMTRGVGRKNNNCVWQTAVCNADLTGAGAFAFAAGMRFCAHAWRAALLPLPLLHAALPRRAPRAAAPLRCRAAAPRRYCIIAPENMPYAVPFAGDGHGAGIGNVTVLLAIERTFRSVIHFVKRFRNLPRKLFILTTLRLAALRTACAAFAHTLFPFCFAFLTALLPRSASPALLLISLFSVMLFSCSLSLSYICLIYICSVYVSSIHIYISYMSSYLFSQHCLTLLHLWDDTAFHCRPSPHITHFMEVPYHLPILILYCIATCLGMMFSHALPCLVAI